MKRATRMIGFFYFCPEITPKSMIVYLIRHTAVGVPRGICYGQTDVPLAATFAGEATLVREQLAGIAFDRVFTSPLNRCRRLAAFCGFPDAQTDDRLKEVNFGQWEMCSYNDLYTNDPRFSLWCDDYIRQRPPGGETMEEVLARFDSFLNERLRGQSWGHVALFCHGGLLSLAEGRRVGGACIATPLTMFPYGHVLRMQWQELQPPAHTRFILPPDDPAEWATDA